MVQRRGALLEPLFRISEGFFFGPHRLIIAALLYFEEKVHRKKLLRADAIPLLFPRLLCQILEHLGYPSEPQLERRRICRDLFTLDKWTSMIAYDVEPGAPVGPEHLEIPQLEHLNEPQPVEIPADMRAPAPTVPSIGPMPEVASSAPPTTPGTPLVVPAASEPHPSESRIAISISEFRGLCHTFRHWPLLRASWLSRWRPYVHIRISLSPPRPSILPSLGRYNSIWAFYHHLSTICLSHQSLQIHPRVLL